MDDDRSDPVVGLVTTKPQSLSIVIPMLNEAEGIATTIEAVRAATEELVDSGAISSCELVLVDDGSTDGSPEVVAALTHDLPWVRVVRHERNRGLGGAIKTGFAESTGELVLYTDADLPFDLGELARACRLLATYGADVVSAYRHDRTAEGPRRAVYSFAYNHLIRWTFGLRVRDVNFAFKLVRRPVLDAIHLESEGSFIDAELLVRAHTAGFKILQIGVDYFPRTRGVSTLSSAATIKRIVGDVVRLRKDVLASPGGAGDGGDGGIRLLVVNADDYGLTAGVSRGILRAHTDGIVTSATVIALGSGFAQAGPWLVDAPGLGVGVHLAAVGEDPPLLSAREIPTLVDGRGRLALSWRHLLPRLAAGRVDPDDLRREFTAQLDLVAAHRAELTHLDSHQHLHLWPTVRDVVLELALARGISAVRIPRATGGGAKARMVNRLAGPLTERAERAGLRFPDATIGYDQSGQLDRAALHAALRELAATGARTAELLTHPGEPDDPPRARYEWGYRWEDELDALCGDAARAVVAEHGFTLATFAELPVARTA